VTLSLLTDVITAVPSISDTASTSERTDAAVEAEMVSLTLTQRANINHMLEQHHQLLMVSINGRNKTVIRSTNL